MTTVDVLGLVLLADLDGLPGTRARTGEGVWRSYRGDVLGRWYTVPGCFIP